jgi:hypothetical protein
LIVFGRWIDPAAATASAPSWRRPLPDLAEPSRDVTFVVALACVELRDQARMYDVSSALPHQ